EPAVPRSARCSPARTRPGLSESAIPGRRSCTAPSRPASPFLVLPCPCLRLPPRLEPALAAPASPPGCVATVLPAAAVRLAVRPPNYGGRTRHLPPHQWLRLAATDGAPPRAAVVLAPSSICSSSPCACSRSPSPCCRRSPPAPASSHPTPAPSAAPVEIVLPAPPDGSCESRRSYGSQARCPPPTPETPRPPATASAVAATRTLPRSSRTPESWSSSGGERADSLVLPARNRPRSPSDPPDRSGR